MMIVKLQRSLATSNSVQRVLVYNEPRTIQLEQEMTKKLSALFGSKDKIYARANYKRGNVTIKGLVRAQSW
jgi:hypothetical protein